MCCCVCATVSYRIFPTLHVRAPMWAQNGAANLPGHTGLYKKMKCLYNLYVYLNNYPSIYRYLWYICLSVHPSIHPSTHMDVYNTPICIQYICNWSVIVCTHAYNYTPHMHTAANMYTCMHVCTVYCDACLQKTLKSRFGQRFVWENDPKGKNGSTCFSSHVTNAPTGRSCSDENQIAFPHELHLHHMDHAPL